MAAISDDVPVDHTPPGDPVKSGVHERTTDSTAAEITENTTPGHDVTAKQHISGKEKDHVIKTTNSRSVVPEENTVDDGTPTCVVPADDMADDGTPTCIVPADAVADDETPTCVVPADDKADDGTPTCVVPADDIADDGTPTCVVSADDKADDGTPTCVVPADDIADDGTPTCVVPADDIADDGTPTCVVPADDKADDGTPTCVVPADAIADDGTPTCVVPADDVADDGTPTCVVPADDKADDGMPTCVVPADAVADDGTTTCVVPADDIADDGMPTCVVPADAVADDGMPTCVVPADAVADDGMPTCAVPEDAKADDETPTCVVPADAIADDGMPTCVVPEDAKADDETPTCAVPADAIADDGTPSCVVPADAIADDGTPSCVVPADESANNVNQTSSIPVQDNSHTTVPSAELKNVTSNETNPAAPDTDSEKEILRQVLFGCCPLNKLPPLIKKVVRIFVSSTFSDTKEERNALMEKVYPKVAAYCREKFGLEFQVVDMRWGVPEQASDNHSTTDLCLQELRKCQEVSVGPNFVAIVGNKYGYRPIPNTISTPEFELLREAAKSSQEEQWQTVEEWYTRDENAHPTVHVLNTISNKLIHYNNTKNAELRKEAREEWAKIERVLTETLRRVSALASSQGRLSPKQKHQYFMSVTENEITHGMLETSGQLEQGCFCILRQIPDLQEHLKEPKAPKFTDMKPDQTQDVEAGRLLSDLRENRLLQRVPEGNLTKVEVEWKACGGSISMETATSKDVSDDQPVDSEAKKNAIQKHKEYLETVCNEFYEKINRLITDGGLKNQQLYDELTSEVLQHNHFSKERVQVFEGRDDIMSQVKAYLGSNCQQPLVIHGQSGCGKTSVMAKVYEQIQLWSSASNKSIVCVLRFLGTTPMTSNVHQLLSSICSQLSAVYGKAWEEPEKFSDLVKGFSSLMDCASREKPLLILLDSIDQLLPVFNAYNMKWLPESLPNFVKIVISTIDEGFPIVDAMKARYSHKKLVCIEVKPLGDKIGMEVIMKLLKNANRSITTEQQGIVQKALEQCSLPLFARIAFDQICRWRSFDVPASNTLEASIQSAINSHFEHMENKLGKPLVKHSLAYLTSARFGLSEVELEHILSLDDQLLSQIYQYWKPPIRRIPPLLWTRVRHEIENYVVERSADDLLVLQWYHRQFISTARQRYLQDQTFSEYIHTNMADYFLGKWANGKAKSFEYTEAQMKRFGLTESKGSADRKVPSQPFYMEVDTDQMKFRYNQRKLSELPMHLHQSGQLEVLKKEIFFNYQWLYAKLKCQSAQSIIQEIELFMAENRALQKSTDLKILLATFQLIRPYVNKYPECLSLELTSRLAKHIGFHPLITRLIQQCDIIGILHFPLVPFCTCYETADFGLKQNINVRTSEPWQEGGCFTCNAAFDTMYIIDGNEQGDIMLSTWDIESGERIMETALVKPKQEDASDEFFQCFLDKSEKHLIALYRKRYHDVRHMQRYKNDGYIDIINVTDGVVVRTIQEFLYNYVYRFCNCVLYLTEHWIGVRFGWKIPLLNLQENDKVQLTQPHILTRDESKMIFTRTKKYGVKSYVGEEKVITDTRTKMATIKDFKTKEDLGEFDQSDGMAAVTLLHNDTSVLLATVIGTIHLYELNRLSPGKIIKVKKVLTLPNTERVRIMEEMKTNNEKQCIEQNLIVSPDDQYVVGVFQAPEYWEAMLWNLSTSKYVARISDRRHVRCKYPFFSSDSKLVILCSQYTVTLVSCFDGDILKTYDMQQTIRDSYASPLTPMLVLLLGKDVAFLSTEVEIDEQTSKKLSKKQREILKNQNTRSLLPREYITNHKVLPEILLEPSKMQLLEDYGPLHSADLESLNSARSTQRSPLDSWITPNGEKSIQLHVRTQVVDVKNNDIRYTPRSRDVVLRPVISSTGTVTNEQLEFPSLRSGGTRVMALEAGDRIVGEGNKVRLRVLEDSKEVLKIMTVPSMVTVSTMESGKPKRLLKFTVFGEAIETVSDKYIVTVKDNTGGNVQFVHVFGVDDGKLLTTHEVAGLCSCARISSDNTRLCLINTELVLWVYAGPSFINLEFKLNLAEKNSSFKWNVKDIIDFPLNRHCVVVKYTRAAVTSDHLVNYQYVDLTAHSCSPCISVKLGVEDISRNGRFAVDSQLNLYDLVQGQQVGHIPYSNMGINMQLQVRLLDDSHIVLVDKQDDTIHVLNFSGETVRSLATFFTHAPLMPIQDGVTSRANGDVIVTYKDGGKIRGMFKVIKPEKSLNICYDSELDRAVSLLPELHEPKMPASENAQQISLNKFQPLPMLNSRPT